MDDSRQDVARGRIAGLLALATLLAAGCGAEPLGPAPAERLAQRVLAGAAVITSAGRFVGRLEPPQVAAVTSAVPGLRGQVTYHPARPLVAAYAGRRPAPLPAEPPDVQLSARLVAVAIPELPREAAHPLEAYTRLVITHTGEPLVLPALRLTRGSRAKWTARPAAVLARALELLQAPALPLADLRAALVSDVTTVFRLAAPSDPAPATLRAAPDAIEVLVEVSGPEPSLEVALDVRRVEVEPARQRSLQRHELIVLESRAVGDAVRRPRAGWVAFIPYPGLVPDMAGVALLLELDRPPPRRAGARTRHAQTLLDYREQQREVQRELPRRPPGAEAAGELPTEVMGRFTAPRRSELREAPRRGLLRLGLAVDLPLLVDAAMLLDEDAVTRLRDRVLPLTAGPQRRPPRWPLLRATLHEVVATAQRDDAPAWTLAALVEHAGGLALSPLLLERRLRQASDAASWQRSLLEINRLGLAHHRPAVRVRSNQWLVERGEGVPGYAPLAPEPARRIALERAAAPSPTGAPP